MEEHGNPSRTFAASVARRLAEAGYVALFAGGCVRDELLGRVPKDHDVATDAPPDAVRRLFGHRRTLAVGAAFGVIVVLPNRRDRDAGVPPVEVATFRTDGGYTDGRRPDAVRFSTPEEDAARRDFTVNGLFRDPATGGVIDHVGGRADLDARVIRAIGDPRARMGEDKLRLLRAVRFAATLGFALDPATADAVRAMADQLPVVSGERIGAELRRMLAHPTRSRAVRLLDELGLLGHVLPESSSTGADVLARLPDGPVPVPLALAALLIDCSPADVGVVAARLRLSNEEADRTADLLARRDALRDAATLPKSVLYPTLAAPSAADLVALTRADRLAAGAPTDDAGHAAAVLRDTPRAVLDPPPLLTGRDLIDAGLTPGPHFGGLLARVRAAQLDGEVTDRAGALGLIA